MQSMPFSLTPQANPESDRFLTRLIYAGGIAVTVFLLLLGWIVFRVQKAAKISIETSVRMESDLAQALYLDLVLSGYARTAATTGESKWESRYAIMEPKLNATLNEIFSIIPDEQRDSLKSQTLSAGQQLRGKEKRAFTLLDEKNRAQAYALLFEESYDIDRESYYKALNLVGAAIKEYQNNLIRQGRRELYRTIFILMVAFPVLFVSGLTLYRLLNRWQSELRHLNQRLEQLVVTDELTQLYNRRFLYQELAREIERAKRYGEKLSILISDIDHFKKVNDTYGHAVGDIVLKAASKCFKSSVRPTDYACRFGGEEFVIILPKTGGEDAIKFAERIRQDLASQTISYEDGKTLNVTVSMGVTEYKSGEELDALIIRADSGLYEAKESGRNRCILKQEAVS